MITFPDLLVEQLEHRPVRLGITAVVKTTREESNGAFGLIELTLAPHFANMAAHWHEQTLETVYVLAGTLAFTVGDATFTGTSGRVVIIPPLTVHHIWNPTDAPATLLQLVTPGGYEAYFAELATVYPVKQIDAPQLNIIAAKYDQFVPAVPS